MEVDLVDKKMDDVFQTSKQDSSVDVQRTGNLARIWSSLSRRRKFRHQDTINEHVTESQPLETIRSQKNDKNIFQRFRIQLEKKFPGCRLKSSSSKSATEEHLYWHREPEFNLDDFDKCSKASGSVKLPVMEGDERRKHLTKKWLEKDTGPDIVMYNACSEMLSHAWYWGQISRFEAQRQLKDTPSGSFLIRDSEKDGPQFTLSFRMWDRTLHYRIQHFDNYWHFEARKYESMVDMVENFMHRSADEVFLCFVQRPSEMHPPYPVVLRYPISRYSKITALQELSRRVIRKNMDHMEISQLPIPGKLREYLTEQDENS